MLLCGLLVYLPSITRAASAILICLISVATLNYVRPHKNRFLFWASQGSFTRPAESDPDVKIILSHTKGSGADIFMKVGKTTDKLTKKKSINVKTNGGLGLDRGGILLDAATISQKLHVIQRAKIVKWVLGNQTQVLQNV